jgi:hypothetical protein
MLSTTALILSTALLAADGTTASCALRFEALASTAMSLDYRTFDQTPGQGFRVLAAAGCPRESADLIERYIAHTGATQRSLRWHLAQMRGEAGQIDAARSAATGVLLTDEAVDAAFRWNAHVRAYIAFLDADRAAFDAAVTELDRHADAHQGNAMNRDFWRSLQAHFQLGYPRAIAAMAGD